MTNPPYGLNGANSGEPPTDPLRWGVALYNVNPGEVTHEYDTSKDAMWSYYREHECPVRGVFQKKGTSVLSVMRSSACEHFLTQTEAAWMLQIDSDIGFDCDDIDKMLEVADPTTSPIVCGLYISSLPEGLAACAWEEVNGNAMDADATRALIDAGVRLHPVARVGAGFLLVHHTALEKMHANHPLDPWFGEVTYDGVKQGEDFTFCIRALECSLPIHVDLGVNLIHVKTIHLNKDMLGNVRITTV